MQSRSRNERTSPKTKASHPDAGCAGQVLGPPIRPALPGNAAGGGCWSWPPRRSAGRVTRKRPRTGHLASREGMLDRADGGFDGRSGVMPVSQQRPTTATALRPIDLLLREDEPKAWVTLARLSPTLAGRMEGAGWRTARGRSRRRSPCCGRTRRAPSGHRRKSSAGGGRSHPARSRDRPGSACRQPVFLPRRPLWVRVTCWACKTSSASGLP